MLVMFIAVYNIWVKVGSTNLRLQTFQSRPFSGMSSVIINSIVYHWQIQRGAKGPPSPKPPSTWLIFLAILREIQTHLKFLGH